MNQDESRQLRGHDPSWHCPLPALCVCAIHQNINSWPGHCITTFHNAQKRCQGSNNVKPVHSIPRAGQLLIQSQRQCTRWTLPRQILRAVQNTPARYSVNIFCRRHAHLKLNNHSVSSFRQNGRTSTNLELC